MSPIDLNALLGLDRYRLDDQSHIRLDQRLCRKCETRPCLKVCPAGVYRRSPEEEIVIMFENCLECGTCQVACDTQGEGGLTWCYPNGGCGVVYRFG